MNFTPPRGKKVGDNRVNLSQFRDKGIHPKKKVGELVISDFICKEPRPVLCLDRGEEEIEGVE